MLPFLPANETLEKIYADFHNDLLAKKQFKGEIRTDYAARLSLATDNSIYQVVPQIILFPKSNEDIQHALMLAAQEPYKHTIKFAPRGGGTATNGQSLSAGIIIDCSKYFRHILEVNLEEEFVRVQCGVVLDQLNEFLSPLGFYFAPQVSTSNRATIGGMINTDACGNGSKLLGRTSDYVMELKCIDSKGQIFSSIQDSVYRNSVTDVLQHHQDEIHKRFKNVPRTLNGYNLGKANASPANLNYLLSGSEGTLAIVTEAQLHITRIPKFKKTILIKYRSFDNALRAQELKLIKPQVIETIDEKLLSLARQDENYYQIKHIIDNEKQIPQAINIVELVSNSDMDIVEQVTTLCEEINKNKNVANHALGFYIANSPTEVKQLWNLRKRAVGLISRARHDGRIPIPFVEDTAVPPENLADYISEFKMLLDSYKLEYGMYGHVDAGCIHIRPALNMQNSDDAALIKILSKKVIELLEKYQGVMWGEHGKGYRSKFSKYFFGTKLNFALQQVKNIFDPTNRLNPGKIAVPLQSEDKIVSVTDDFRAKFDKVIPEAVQSEFSSVMSCNGNAACFNYSSQDVMCPSYKVTRDRIHSPKGRAVLMREWLRLLSLKNFFTEKPKGSFSLRRFFRKFSSTNDFSREVYTAMNGCLNCKACATQCPLSIDVPDFKSRFLEYFHSRYPRPLRDYVVASSEMIAKWQAKFPRLTNFFLTKTFIQNLAEKFTHLANIPLVGETSLKKLLNPKYFNLKNISANDSDKTIILLQDAFTSFYEPRRVFNIIQTLEALGFNVYVASFFPSGKGLHVKGFLKKFQKIVHKNIQHLQKLSSYGVPLVGIDPSITLTYRDEYRKFSHSFIEVKLLQEWLVDKIGLPKSIVNPKTFYLLSHCSEKTLCVTAEEQWVKIFASFGHRLLPVSVGCCGMAGIYGHEIEHVTLSQKLFAMSWEDNVNDISRVFVATGYSCRSQAKRFANKNLLHPLELLNELIL